MLYVIIKVASKLLTLYSEGVKMWTDCTLATLWRNIYDFIDHLPGNAAIESAVFIPSRFDNISVYNTRIVIGVRRLGGYYRYFFDVTV